MAIQQVLADWIADRANLVIVGIGNPFRRDDGVGVEVAKRLKDAISDDSVLVLESQSVPESYLQPITDFTPSHLLLIDAADLGLAPGQLRFSSESDAGGVAVSTHALPLRLVCRYLTRVTGAKIGLLLIQPESVNFGEGLSPTVDSVATQVVEVLRRLFS